MPRKFGTEVGGVNTRTALITVPYSQTTTVTNKYVVSEVASLVAASTSGYSGGDEIVVVGVGAPYDGTWKMNNSITGTEFKYTISGQADLPNSTLAITNSYLVSNVATIVVADTTGYAGSDHITVSGLASAFNGSFFVTAVTPTTITYPKTNADIPNTTAVITNATLSGNVATLTTADTALYGGTDAVVVAGVGSPFDGPFTLSSITGTTFVYALTHADVLDTTANVLNQSLTSNVATLTVADTSLFGATETIKVSALGAPFDGVHTMTSKTGTTLVFPCTASNVPDTAVPIVNKVLTTNMVTLTTTGSTAAFTAADPIRVTGLGAPFDGLFTLDSKGASTLLYAVTNADIPDTAIVITNRTISANVATLTTASTAGFSTSDLVHVFSLGAPFDGVFTLTGTTGTTLTYALTNADILDATLTVTNKALTSNVATLTVASTTGYIPTDSIVVAGVGGDFDGTFTIVGVTGTDISYNCTGADVPSAIATGTILHNYAGGCRHRYAGSCNKYTPAGRVMKNFAGTVQKAIAGSVQKYATGTVQKQPTLLAGSDTARYEVKITNLDGSNDVFLGTSKYVVADGTSPGTGQYVGFPVIHLTTFTEECSVSPIYAIAKTAACKVGVWVSRATT